MSHECRLAIAGTHVLLLAGKALYWPAGAMLCVADVHFGKAAAYRASGQPVPHGTTQDNLDRLDALLSAYPSKRLVFLGDFLHARASRARSTLDALHAWRRGHPELACTLVRGNHDLHAGDPPLELGIDVVNEPMPAGPFALRHNPGSHASLHVIAGHVHPVYTLRGLGRERVRLPCFHHQAHATLLPSFGDFTGGHAIALPPGSRIFVTDGSRIWPVSVA